MNFIKERDFTKPRVMKHGDLVIVYERHDSLDHFYLNAGTIFNNKYGTFPHNDMIGKPFGSKIHSKSSPGYVYILEPTPELWTTALHTRTQIVDELDSSVVTLCLDVHPGSVVVETGTGSGCMTLSLARAAHPNGHVYTYEYNGVRAQKAREEFEKLGVDNMITVTHRDVCKQLPSSNITEEKKESNSSEASATSNTDPVSSTSSSSTTDTPIYCTKPGGFPNVANATADAVFLDLPEPWLALEHAKRVLKPGRSLCSYSPSIDQVIKTCDKLRELKFHSIRMLEVRQRPYDARVVELETLDLGLSEEGEFLNNRSARDRENIHQRNKPRRDNLPIFQSRDTGNAGPTTGTSSTTTAVVKEGEEDVNSESEEQEEGEQQQGPPRKRKKSRFVAPVADTPGATSSTTADTTSTTTAAKEELPIYTQQHNMTDEQFRSLQNRIKNRPVSNVNGSYEMHIARPVAGMKGHTAFLTFAVAPL